MRLPKAAILSIISLHALAATAASPHCGLFNPSLPRSRFERPILALEAFLQPADLKKSALNATIDRMVEKDARGSLFMIEGLLRIYSRIYKDGPFKDLKKSVEEFENALGHYSELKGYADKSVKLGAAADVQALFKTEALEAKQQLMNLMPDLGSFIANLRRVAMETHAWHAEAQDTREVLEAIIAEVRKILDKKYDLSVLQGQFGIHELRRNLRWFLIYIQSFFGLILPNVLGNDPLAGLYGELIGSAIDKSPFSQIEADPNLRHSKSISRLLFLAISKKVSELSSIKDFGEIGEALERAYERLGYRAPKEEALALLRNQPGFLPNLAVPARAIYQEIMGNKLLELFIAEITP